MKIIAGRAMCVLVMLFFIASMAQAAVCRECGNNNSDQYKFCTKCGAPLGAEGVLMKEQHEKAQGQVISGPKKTVAVVGFENASGLHSYIDLGDDFSSQLTDALIQSGKFVVLSRTELASVLGEQDLAASGRMAKSQSAATGKIIPAQILVTGKITEFEENTGGGSQGFSVHGVTIGSSKASAHVAVIVQIIDSTTSEVLNSERIEGRAEAGGFSIGYSGSFSLGSSSFKKTPLGKATQIAIDRAVVYIADKLSRFPWQGRVVTVKDNLVYINAGSDVGIVSGMRFSVYHKGESLVDPETGIELGSEKTKVADISVVETAPKYSKAQIISSSGEIAASDLVFTE